MGGDYFDVIAVDENRWAALVVDVSGKGVSSALVASLLQGAFLTFADGPIDDKIRRVNRLLNERTEEGKYATIFYCTIDRAGVMQYVNAGHCSPILISRGEKVQYLETTGVPAGLVDDAEFLRRDVQLRPRRPCGDLQRRSDRRARRGWRILRTPEAARLIEAHPGSRRRRNYMSVLVQTLESFSEGAVQADDVTLLVLQYCPPA